MRIDEVTDTDIAKMVALFGDLLKICQQELDFDKLPKIVWVSDGSYGTKFHSFGSFQPDAGIVTVSITGRHIIDMMRTLAHELVHYKQMLDGRLGPNAGETGSPIENEANAMAGVIMRKFDHMHPEAFAIKPIMEDTRAKLNRLLAEGPAATQQKPAAQQRPTAAPPDDNFVTGIAKGIGSAINPSNWLGSGPDKQLQQNVKNVVQNPNQGNVGNVVGQAVVNNAPGTGNVKNAASAASNTVDAVKKASTGDIKGAANSAIDAGTNALGAVLPLAGTAASAATSLFRNSTPAEPGNYPSDQNNEDQAISELNELLGEVNDDSSLAAQSSPKNWNLPNNLQGSLSTQTAPVIPSSTSLKQIPTPKTTQSDEPSPSPLSVGQVQTPSGPVRTGSAQVGAGPIVGQFSTSNVGGNADTGIGSQRSNTTNLSTALPLGLRAGVTSNQSNGQRNNTVDVSKNLSLGDKGNLNVGSNIPTNGGKPSFSGSVNYGGLNANANVSPGGQKQFTVGYNKSFESIKRLNDLLAEHSVEIGHIYGNKKLPQTKDRIHSADKGKIHRGLRISEVVGGTPEVYVDMDGVLADFFKDWNKMVGVGHWKEIKDPEAALDLIRKHPTFWIDLDVLSNAPRLLGAIKKFAGSYYICTSPLGKDPNCEPQKREWVQKHLSGFAPKEVYVTSNKPQFARQANGTPNILIDDFGKNIAAWTAAGGIGIHYENKNSNRAIMELKAAMNPDPVQTTLDQAKPAKPALEKSKDL